MKLKNIVKKIVTGPLEKLRYQTVFKKYKEFTMIPKNIFIGNLAVAHTFTPKNGAIVECGVWRGGMSGGIADLLGKEREYHLFDSFEGLPEVTKADGVDAKIWQEDKTSPLYFDNCKAEMEYAERAMKMSGAEKYHLHKGWFKDTLPKTEIKGEIALLRLDGDWYDSTMECLVYLYPKVKKGGVIILDDYYIWEGSTKAIHDYLSKNQLFDPIRQSKAGVAYIIKS